MYHVDNPSAVPDMPPIDPVQSVDPKWFQNGGEGQAPTYPGQEWFNIVQAELLNVLALAGVEPDKMALDQLKTAIFKSTFTSWLPIDQNVTLEAPFSYIYTAPCAIQLTAEGHPFFAMVDFATNLNAGDCAILAPSGQTIQSNMGQDATARILVTGRPYLFYRVGPQWRVSEWS
ncbi:hypothetical protein [Aeromonas veronii]|uniref:hypothetical protein n=1 Tax=Aeromonas veronii TaxID=654 RepID=UPI002444F756|nr:hypothetical protein [Aeromonas veronii]